MAKRKTAIKHTVKAVLKVPLLAKAGSSLKLNIYSHKEKIGEIRLGRGSLFWWGRKKKDGTKISWSRFADMMDKLANER